MHCDEATEFPHFHLQTWLISVIIRPIAIAFAVTFRQLWHHSALTKEKKLF